MSGGGGYSLDSTTAHSDTTSQQVGGNAGIVFNQKGKDTVSHLVIAAAAVIVLMMLTGKGKG